MKTNSVYRSYLLRYGLTLFSLIVIAAATLNAAPQRRAAKKSKSVKARAVKKAHAAQPAQASLAVTDSTPSQIPTALPHHLVVVSVPSQIPTATAPNEAKAKPSTATLAAAAPSESAASTNNAPEASAPPVATQSKSESAADKQKLERTLLEAPLRGDENWRAQWQNAMPPQIERAWYSACYTDKDTVLCENFSLLLIRTCASSAYFVHASKFVINYGTERYWHEFQKALGDYYSGAPNAAKLNHLFSTGEPLINLPYVLAQMTLAGTSFSMTHEFREAEQVKIAARVKTYLERALQVFASADRGEQKLSQTDWDNFRRSLFASGNQFLGYYAWVKDHNAEQALLYLTRSIAVKGDDKLGWKDPLNYYLRTNVNNEFYARASNKYGALSDELRNGEVGKALLAEIQNFMQKLAEDYARIMVVTQSNRPEYREYRDYAESSLRAFMRLKPNPEAAYQELIKRIQAEFAAA